MRPTESQEIKGQRKKEKVIRLDDLVPKQDVTDGHQLLFGATDTIQPNQKGKSKMTAKKGKKKVKVQDLKAKKDAKGGVIAIIKPTQQGAGKNPTRPGSDWSFSSGGD